MSPTISMLAERAVALRPTLDRSKLVHTAERASFMFNNQVAILEDEEQKCYLFVEPIPAFAAGCAEELLKKPSQRNSSPAAAAGTPPPPRPHRLKKPLRDSDVLNQQTFFSQFSEAQLRDWIVGKYDRC